MDQETYVCGTSGMTLQELANAGVTVVSHVRSVDPKMFREAHGYGLKVLTYISLYKMFPVSTGASPLMRKLRGHPFWKEADPTGKPTWWYIGPDGKWRFPQNNPKRVGQRVPCYNQQVVQDAYVRGVRNLMEIGADGVFIDNVHAEPPCSGPKFGRHQHTWPDKDQLVCFKMLLTRIDETVKSYGPDKIVVLNSGGLVPEYFGYGDCYMWESYVWRSGISPDRGPLVKVRRWNSWESVLAGYRKYEKWSRNSKTPIVVAPLTYLPDRHLVAKNSFFAYGCSRLSGFTQWHATGYHHRDVLRLLYRARPGRPVGPLEQQGLVAWRQYERGLVVVNGGTEPASAEVPAPAIAGPLAELSSGETVAVKGGRIRVDLPGETGRVYLSKADVLWNFLREVEGQAAAARLRIGKDKATAGKADVRALLSRLGHIEKLALKWQDAVRKGQDVDRAALCALTLDELAPPEGERDLARHLDNVRRYLRLAAGLAEGVHLRIDVGAPVVGTAVPCDAVVIGRAVTAKSGFRLTALANGTPVAVSRAKADRGPDRARFTLRIASNVREGAGLEVRSAAAVTRRNGDPLVLEQRVVTEVRPELRVADLRQLPPLVKNLIVARVTLGNPLAQAIKVTAGLSLPKGWTHKAMPAEVHIQPRGKGSITFLIGCPAEACNTSIKAGLDLATSLGLKKRQDWVLKASPLAEAPTTRRPPRIDGRLADPAWKRAQRVTFVDYNTAAPPKGPTDGYLLYDSKHLYAAFRCSAAQVPQQTRAATSNPFRSDTAELYIWADPEGDRVSKFVVRGAGGRKSRDAGPWRSAASRTKDVWIVEMAIPWATLGLAPPQPDDVWGLNLCRTSNWPNREFTCWSATYGPFKLRNRFGWVRFGQ